MRGVRGMKERFEKFSRSGRQGAGQGLGESIGSQDPEKCTRSRVRGKSRWGLRRKRKRGGESRTNITDRVPIAGMLPHAAPAIG